MNRDAPTAGAVSIDDVACLVQRAFATARVGRTARTGGPLTGPQARAAGTAWVSQLAQGLREHPRYKENGHVVLERGCSDHRREFGVNELMFDVLVARTRPVTSPRGRTISAIAHAEWAIESELQRNDSRALLVDLNKLVIARAAHKLFVISDASVLVDWAYQTMTDAFQGDPAQVFLAVIPHPQRWHAETATHVRRIG